VIEALGDVSAAVEVGGFVGTTRALVTSRTAPPILFTARASVLKAIGGHDGVVIEPSIGLLRPSRKWTTIGTLNATYASGAFQRTFFGVDAAGAAASGLPQFDAEGGIRDVGATAVVTYRFTEKWGVNSVASYSRLIGDAADSPVVTQEGSPDQLFFGLNVSYRFF